ncbi:LPXTG cell wall anchor domain-containing protein [Cryptosporangium sp. NPDC048952]|uniref:LPXTG cell wall anchor domain-containing protein n=1 Tax=Cryptosporangium sp. NPDC048952 TaxID=3363961 RepID=UPI0037128F46
MKPRFRRLAYAGAATVGAAVTAFVLAGGPTTASAEQCGNAVTQPLAVECVSDTQGGAALAGQPGARVAAATPNEASPPADENEGGAVQPGSSTGPEVPETPGEESGNQPVQPQASTPPEVPETTPPAEETPPGQPQVPGEGTTPPPSVETTPPGQPQQPESGQNQPELPVTGRDDGPKIAGLGAGILAAGAALVAASRRRRS